MKTFPKIAFLDERTHSFAICRRPATLRSTRKRLQTCRFRFGHIASLVWRFWDGLAKRPACNLMDLTDSIGLVIDVWPDSQFGMNSPLDFGTNWHIGSFYGGPLQVRNSKIPSAIIKDSLHSLGSQGALEGARESSWDVKREHCCTWCTGS